MILLPIIGTRSLNEFLFQLIMKEVMKSNKSQNLQIKSLHEDTYCILKDKIFVTDPQKFNIHFKLYATSVVKRRIKIT